MRQVVTFDAYGTLIDFRLADAVRQVLADRLPMDGVDSQKFLDDYQVMRFQAVAQQARAYKPARRAFEHAYAAMDIPPARVTHVAQGWEYDIIPTRDLGLRRRIWIYRHGRPGGARYRPYDELPSLSGVPGLLAAGRAS